NDLHGDSPGLSRIKLRSRGMPLAPMPECCCSPIAFCRVGFFTRSSGWQWASRVKAPCGTTPLKRARTMADTGKVRFESRMLIDGKLVDGEAGTFTNINPATEEVLGEVADASRADMHRAIDASRRAFDESDWSTNRQLRKRCLEQLQEALEGEQEAL